MNNRTAQPDIYRSYTLTDQKVSNESLREMQMAELEILNSVADFCDGHGIRYYLASGTLLGAVRHKGFIPWDDDIDIVIRRDEYERFLAAAKAEGFEGSLELKHYSTDAEFDRTYTRVINKKVRVLNTSYQKEVLENAWIDIYPLDALPDNKMLAWVYQFRFLIIRLFYYYSCFDTHVNLQRKDRGTFQKAMIWIGSRLGIARRLDTRKLIERQERFLKSHYSASAKRMFLAYTIYFFKEVYPQEWYAERIKLSFEGKVFWCPKEYSKVLTQMYGNYMKPVPEEKRMVKHTFQIIREEEQAKKQEE